jgi:hypothetical protein
MLVHVPLQRFSFRNAFVQSSELLPTPARNCSGDKSQQPQRQPPGTPRQ